VSGIGPALEIDLAKCFAGVSVLASLRVGLVVVGLVVVGLVVVVGLLVLLVLLVVVLGLLVAIAIAIATARTRCCPDASDRQPATPQDAGHRNVWNAELDGVSRQRSPCIPTARLAARSGNFSTGRGCARPHAHGGVEEQRARAHVGLLGRGQPVNVALVGAGL